MKQRVFGVFGGWRRRSLIAAALAVVAGGVFAISAMGVHDEAFQLDGDVLASTTTNVGGTPQTVDWNSIFNATGGEITPRPTGFTAATFDKDFTLKANGSFDPADTDIFTTGSKDELPISGWQCKASNNVTDKNDIMNAYATAYTAPNGDRLLYFALEKNDNTGTNDVGFWFLQGAVGCDGSQGTATFTGAHADGDLLVVSEFTNGGVVSTIKVYRWNGGANGSLGVATPIADGVDCQLTAENDEACATVNRPPDGATGNGTITTPWPTANKSDGPGNSLRTGEFFEGGLNLTANNLAGKCFNTFLADTRASSSTTSDLEDFSVGSLGACESQTVTDPVESDGATPLPDPPDGPLIPTDGTIEVRDQATVTVQGVSTFSGTVTFHICGPIATGTCDSGGLQIGTPQTVTSTPATVTSIAATITEAGRYCWRADFSGDSAAGVPPSHDSSASECFVIKPRPTMLVTQGNGTVQFGQPVTDTATLTNTANQPGTGGGGTNGSINPTTAGGPADGTITFTLYKSCGPPLVLATGTGTNPQSVTVSGDATYGPVSFTPDAPGTYFWVATYDGDSPNTLASVSPACGVDPNETVVVQQIPTDIRTKQSWFPNDTAEIEATSGNLDAGGTVLFELFTNATCQGTAVYSQPIVLQGGAPTEEVGTTNSSYRITTGYDDAANSLVGQHSWRVTYTPDANDPAHTGSRSTCDSEHFNITYTNDPGPGTDIPNP